MSESISADSLLDNGGRRSGLERRQFSYSEHIPERRKGGDRRSGKDRRRLKRKASRMREDMILED